MFSEEHTVPAHEQDEFLNSCDTEPIHVSRKCVHCACHKHNNGTAELLLFEIHLHLYIHLYYRIHEKTVKLG